MPPHPIPQRAHTHLGLRQPQVRGMPAPRDSQTRAHCLSVGVLHSFLPHPSQPRPQSSPALSASNLCSERAPPARSGSRTEERNPLAALRSPPPAPEDRLRHWGAAGDRFFLQPGLRGRGHSAACGNRGGGLLGEITALGNRDALEPRAAPSLSPPMYPPLSRCIPGIVVPSMPAGSGSARSWTTSPRIGHAQWGPWRDRYQRRRLLRFSRCAEEGVSRATACQRLAFPK